MDRLAPMAPGTRMPASLIRLNTSSMISKEENRDRGTLAWLSITEVSRDRLMPSG